MKPIWLVPMIVLLLAGCGSYSQSRYDDLELIKANTIHLVTRAQEDKLSPVELRTGLETIDKALLGEKAHEGKEAELEKTRAKLLDQSDAATASLFNGDNGRE